MQILEVARPEIVTETVTEIIMVEQSPKQPYEPPSQSHLEHRVYYFKQCPRCMGGDLYHERDRFGWYMACLHCGFYLSDEEMLERVGRRIRSVEDGGRGGEAESESAVRSEDYRPGGQEAASLLNKGEGVSDSGGCS